MNKFKANLIKFVSKFRYFASLSMTKTQYFFKIRCIFRKYSRQVVVSLHKFLPMQRR
nr:hypothetical protein [Campylobacter sp.]